MRFKGMIIEPTAKAKKLFVEREETYIAIFDEKGADPDQNGCWLKYRL